MPCEIPEYERKVFRQNQEFIAIVPLYFDYYFPKKMNRSRGEWICIEHIQPSRLIAHLFQLIQQTKNMSRPNTFNAATQQYSPRHTLDYCISATAAAAAVQPLKLLYESEQMKWWWWQPNEEMKKNIKLFFIRSQNHSNSSQICVYILHSSPIHTHFYLASASPITNNNNKYININVIRCMENIDCHNPKTEMR